MRIVLNEHLIGSCFLTVLVTAVLCGCAKKDLNEVEGRIKAPGVYYSAVLFHRQPETLRSETVNVSIIRDGEPLPNDIGNVYSASREQTGAAQRIWMNWRDSSTLQIFRDPKTNAYKEDKHYECMTGVFIQTTPFNIEYGDIKDVEAARAALAKPAKDTKETKVSKDTKATKPRRHK